MSKPPPPSPPGMIRPIAVVIAWVVVLAALPVAANRYWNHPGVIFGIVCCYVCVAFGLRSRLILCALAGVFLGLMFNNTAPSAILESKIWDLVRSLLVGVTIGLSVGVLWDHAATVNDPPQSRGKQKRK